MSMPTAKDLLAQADRLMRQRTPEELPVLTDLVIEEIEIPILSERMDEVIPTRSRPSSIPVSVALPAANEYTRSPAAMPFARLSAPVGATAATAAPRPSHDPNAATATSDSPNTPTATASAREKFNEQLLAKLDELQHSVFSQVMQKLEIHAAGSLKTHLRETLETALFGIARDLAAQVAEDTSTQVRQVVSDAVDAEIARLREQFAKKRF